MKLSGALYQQQYNEATVSSNTTVMNTSKEAYIVANEEFED